MMIRMITAFLIVAGASVSASAQTVARAGRPDLVASNSLQLESLRPSLQKTAPASAERIKAALAGLKVRYGILQGRELITVAAPVQPNSWALFTRAQVVNPKLGFANLSGSDQLVFIVWKSVATRAYLLDCEIEVRSGASAQANVAYLRPTEQSSATRATTPITNGRLVFAVPPGAADAEGRRGFIIEGPGSGMYLVKNCAISPVG